jgi:CxxC-x17-CxxC domain-containing protein
MHMRNYNQQDRSGSGRDFGRRDFGKRDFRDRGERREMFKAVCSECGKDCEIPFEPRDGRPVYCSDCFEKKEGGSRAPRESRDRGQRRPDRPDFERKEAPVIQNNPQLQEISNKLDRILDALILSPLKKEVEKVVVEEKKEPKAKKKVSKPAKKKPVASKK